MKKVINSAPSRPLFRLTSCSGISPGPTFCAPSSEKQGVGRIPAVSARIATFEEVCGLYEIGSTIRIYRGSIGQRFRERYMPDATRRAPEEALASVVNNMLSELHASHTRYYTPHEPEYYQLCGIFAGALRRRGLERAFRVAVSPIPALASSRASACRAAA